jgi:hypothetical protein
MVDWVLGFFGIIDAAERAAAVSGVLNFLGLILTALFAVFAWLGSRLFERWEKVHDFKVALHAEISSELLNLDAFDLDEHLLEIHRRYAGSDQYSVIVPHLAQNVIFEAIVGRIHILPAKVIRPVVEYERLRAAADSFTIDLRDESFRKLSQARQIEMYEGYIDMRRRLRDLANQAATALRPKGGANA